jgi:hypothetical protein
VKEENMKRKLTVISLLVAIAMLALALPGTAVAHPQKAVRFWGPVTVNGADVPDGTVISVWLEGPSVGPWTTTTYTQEGASRYAIDIPADDPATPAKDGAVAGDQVYFSVGGTTVPGAATWKRIENVFYALRITAGALVGDVNGDGHVNALDLVLVGQHFGESGPPGWIPEDVNVDGFVDVLDIILIFQNWTG